MLSQDIWEVLSGWALQNVNMTTGYQILFPGDRFEELLGYSWVFTCNILYTSDLLFIPSNVSVSSK